MRRSLTGWALALGFLASCGEISREPSKLAAVEGTAQKPRHESTKGSASHKPSRPTKSVFIYGEGASLFGLRQGTSPAEDLRSSVWQSLVDTVRQAEPSAVFALGNHASSGKVAEWERVKEGFRQMGAPTYLIRGSKDQWDMPGYTDSGGGPGQRSVDVGRNRFILIDQRDKYLPAFLEFLSDALAGSKKRSNTFVLMRSRSFEASDAKSNWNRDVVPLLRQSGVRYVFCGQECSQFVSVRTVPRRAKVADSKRLYYFSVGFRTVSNGPSVFVELQFDGDKLVNILPRCLPIDLRHPWFHKSLSNVEGTGTVKTYGAWRPARSEPAGKSVKMAFWGHSYVMHTDNHNDGEIVGGELTRKLIDTLNRDGVSHAFAIGDIVFDPRSTAEWELVEEEFNRFEGTMHFIRGNHEWYPELPVYDRMRAKAEAGYAEVVALDKKGEGKIIDIDGSRFVCMDYRNSYSQKDADFLRRGLEGHEKRTNTFFVTHLLSFRGLPIDQAPAGVDPFKPYARYTNFNELIAPVLKGRVNYSIFGDIYYRLAGHYVSPNGGYYLCSGYLFRGTGPMVYVELHFVDGQLDGVIPKVLPVDLRHQWYSYEFTYSYPVHDILRHFVIGIDTLQVRLGEYNSKIKASMISAAGGELVLFGSQQEHDTLANALSKTRSVMK